MKKGISICFFAAVIVLFLLFLVYQNRGSETPHLQEEQTEKVAETENRAKTEPLTESMQIMENEKYYLKESDGYLTVYDSKTNEIYCETNIRFEFLSAEMQEKLKSGVTFQTEAELYDFLESYSS